VPGVVGVMPTEVVASAPAAQVAWLLGVTSEQVAWVMGVTPAQIPWVADAIPA
jgi:hypothetical protein